MADDNKLGIIRVIVEGAVAILTAIFVNKRRRNRKQRNSELNNETTEE